MQPSYFNVNAYILPAGTGSELRTHPVSLPLSLAIPTPAQESLQGKGKRENPTCAYQQLRPRLAQKRFIVSFANLGRIAGQKQFKPAFQSILERMQEGTFESNVPSRPVFRYIP